MTVLPRLCGKIADNYDKSYSARVLKNEFLVSKETVVLRRWERSKQKFGFIKRVDNALTQWAFPILEVALVLQSKGYNCRLFRHQYRSSIECQMHGILQLIVPKEIGFPLC